MATRAQQQAQTQEQNDQPPAQPVFRAGINYVRVDVIVSDKNGANVADLKQIDFEVLEDGKPQTVENFKFIKLDGGAEKPHRVDRDRLAVVQQLEIGGGEIDDRTQALVGDDRVDLHAVGAAAKDGGLRRL